jgi:UDP-N-acetylmuramyl pentapeptide phosphotransferase/UDP-N-acetylglucosamine-1-phosphate transferase
MIEFLTALGVTLLMHPFVIALLRWRQVLDIPSHRSLHNRPIFRGGGLSCAFATAAGVVVAVLRGAPQLLFACLVVALVLASIGFADDIGTIRATPRLAAQVLIGGVAGWLIGGNAAWACVGAVVIATCVNMVNFMDGINGITAYSILIWSGTVLILTHRYHSPALTVIGAVTAGTALGFAPVNSPRPLVFLGDVGSYLFGALVALGILIAWHDEIRPAIVVAPLALYLFDTGVTLIRRGLAGERVLDSHRAHIYQRLVDRAGRPHIVVALGIAAIESVISVLWLEARAWVAASATVLLLILYLAAPALLGDAQPRRMPDVEGNMQ